MGANYKLIGLSKFYGAREVLQNINLELTGSRLLSLMGKNGSGKSTLMKILAQQDVFEQGTVEFDGVHLKSPRLLLNDRMIYITEEQDLPLNISLREWMGYFAKIYHHYDVGLFEFFCHKFNLDPERKFFDFSRGQRMKALFALQAPKKADVYLLDEITSVLDVGSRLVLMEFLSQERSRGSLIVVSTNVAAEMQGFATDVLFLNGAKIELHCPVEKLPQEFLKIRLKPNEENLSRLNSSEVKKANLNADGSWSYILKRSASSAESLKKFEDRRLITIEDISAYYSVGGEV